MDVREIAIERWISPLPAEKEGERRGGGWRTVRVKQACRTLIFIVLLKWKKKTKKTHITEKKKR